jgi:hypothetical protein
LHYSTIPFSSFMTCLFFSLTKTIHFSGCSWSIIDSKCVRSISCAFNELYLTESTFLDGRQSTTSIHWPCYCNVQVYIVNHFCNSMWSFWVEAICAGLLIVLLYIYCRWRSPYQEGRVGIPLTGLIPPHFCVSPKPGSRFTKSYVVVFFVFSEFG